MWYKVEYNALALHILPPFMRKPALAAFAQVCVKPVDSLYYKWKLFREDNIYKLSHTGQICYLRKSLNDRFDVEQRRIYIGEGNIYNTFYLYTEAEAQQRHGNTEQESPTIFLRTEDETADTGLDFIVWVPLEVFNANIYDLHAHIQLYKAGGKRYNIFIIP